jgi:hypothetical protein
MTTDPHTSIYRRAIPPAARIKLRLATDCELRAMEAENRHDWDRAAALRAEADAFRAEAARRAGETDR